MKKGRLTKEELLKIAERHFAKYGYEGTSMSSLAAELGIQKSSLYFHSKSKSDLFLEVFQRVHDNAAEQVLAVYNREDLNEINKLHQMFLLFCTSEAINIFRIGLHPLPELEGKSEEIFLRFEGGFRRLLLDLIGQAKKRGLMLAHDSNDICEALIFIMNGVMFKVMNYQPNEYPEKIELAWRTFLEWATMEKA